MRDYDPTTGRYIQADPLGLVDGASVYGYALQNPGRYTDPRGEDSVNAQSIADIAIGNTNYQKWDPHPEARGRMGKYFNGRFTDKCNMFVYDILSAGGHPPGRDGTGRIPVASTWGNPLSSILGYRPIALSEIRGGDVISNGHHVGIVLGSNNGDGPYSTVSASAIHQTVVNNDWGWRDGPDDDPTAAWRCTCDFE
tara:strand:+ start:8559 stop:9146 length:588 start_codon:yes stop_codon:yes gene_type:complete